MRLIIRDFKKVYDEVTVINKAGYAFEDSHVYGIVGRRNSGKTTLLSCIAGEVPLSGGYVRLDVCKKMQKTDYRNFALLSNESILPDYMTGGEYLEYCMRLHNRTDKVSVEELFLKMKLNKNIQDAFIKNYSPEEKLKLKLAAITIIEPEVILIDEPANMKVINNFIDIMRKGHIIIVTSDSEEKLPNGCDEVLLLNNGVIEGITREKNNA